MHELSLAQAIVAVAEEHAAGRRVSVVEVKVGQLRQVVPSALRFAFELVAEGTALGDAKLELEQVPARVRCRACAGENEVDDFPLVCTSCGSLNVDVVGGDELRVEALELEEELSVGGRR